MTEAESWIILHNALYLNAAKANELLKYYDFNPLEILKREESELSDIIGKNLAKRIKNSYDKIFLQKTLSCLQSENIIPINITSNDYPKILKEIYDPPFLLYAKGNISLLNSLCIAIVGSRKSSEYGNALAFEYAESISKHKITIVSGFARGIDTYAHKGVLKNCDNTIAVFGCGLNIVYPKENEKLYNILASKGLIISEFPIDSPPLSHHFPYRNRIVSGISKGVVVIEAKLKSGALITANMAVDEGKEVWVIPARPIDKSFEGGNHLIKSGAKVVLEPKDVLFDLGINYNENINDIEKFLNNELSNDEKIIWNYLKDEPIAFDELTELCTEFEHSRISYILLHLEMKKLIKKLPGNYIIKALF